MYAEEKKEEETEKDKPAQKKAGGGFSMASFKTGKPGGWSRKVGGGDGKFGRQDFEETLDDLNDDGSKKKKEKSKAEGGQSNFVNLGSQARGGFEEKEQKGPAVKPTFKGKMNVRGDETATGVNTAYDFGVKYKQPYDEFQKERREKNEGEGE